MLAAKQHSQSHLLRANLLAPSLVCCCCCCCQVPDIEIDLVIELPYLDSLPDTNHCCRCCCAAAAAAAAVRFLRVRLTR
jgi:hypothetical protein